MNNKVIETYSFYKELYPEVVLLFRVGEQHKAYFEDAERVAKFCKHLLQNKSDVGLIVPEVTLPVDDILDCVVALSENGIESKVITSRNKSGQYGLPDVSILEKERKIDY